MGVDKRGPIYWYKFTWNGDSIRESTRQGNPRVARQMEAAHPLSLAKGEVGIRDRKKVPTVAEFAEQDFLPHVRTTFAAKQKTQSYYTNGVKCLLAFEGIANEKLDAVTGELISGYVAKRQTRGLQVSSINRELQVLRRMFALAQEWGKVEKVLPRVRMIPGERHRERVLTADEETRYLSNAPPLLRDVASVLIDCGIRPEECFRLKWANVRDQQIEIEYGKTDNARRRIPVSQRVAAILDMRKTSSKSAWVFPSATASGHIEPASLKRQQIQACLGKQNEQGKKSRRKKTEKSEIKWDVEPFTLYTLRHTCLTRWAPHMDPWTLAYLAGHRDMSITKRYVHPQEQPTRQAIERARVAVENSRSGHKTGHSSEGSVTNSSERGAVIQ